MISTNDENATLSFIIFVLGLFLVEILYLWIARKFAILDIPVERSSHSIPTVRGGGIVIYFAFFWWFLQSDQNNLYVFLGLTMLAVASFIDDLGHVKKYYRVSIQVASIVLLVFQVYVDHGSMPLMLMLFVTILLTGTLNAVNFMDGINGLTAFYGLTFLATMLYINQYLKFADSAMILFIAAALIIFGIFNARKTPLCFAGDVGALCMAYILCYLTSVLVYVSGEPLYILMWSVYGLDSVITIVERLLRRDNIFLAHRSHLYQLLTNDLGHAHISVSLLYAGIQLIINVAMLMAVESFWNINSWLLLLLILTAQGVIYVLLKMWVRQRMRKNTTAIHL